MAARRTDLPAEAPKGRGPGTALVQPGISNSGTIDVASGTLTVSEETQSVSFALTRSYAANGFPIIGPNANLGMEVGYS
jgi:hypothetical protein